MNQQKKNTSWERLYKVIEASHLSTNAFAKVIGLARGENLYQIKRGNNRISIDVAQRIHELYPQFSISWLMCGDAEIDVLKPEDAPIRRIPVFRHVFERPYLPLTVPDDHLVLTASETNGAELAVPYTDDILNPYLRNSLLLLRKVDDEIVYGHIHLIETDKIRLFRIVSKDRNPERLRLRTLLPSVYSDIQLPREHVCGLWIVCGAVCRLGQ